MPPRPPERVDHTFCENTKSRLTAFLENKTISANSCYFSEIFKIMPMKKFLFVASAILLCSLSYAQMIPGFSIGPKIGASFSKFTTDENQITEEMKSTFHFGAFARFGKKVYFQPELLVMSRSGILKHDDFPGSSSKLKVNTLDIPLLLGVKFADLKVLNVRAMAGPVASLAINKTIDAENWENAIGEDDLKNVLWGLQFGAGVDLLVFTIDLRYELGLNNLSELENFDLKNNMFTIGLGWKIL